MRFTVREPNGRRTAVRIGDSLVVASVALCIAFTAFAWYSAYRQRSETSQQQPANQSADANQLGQRGDPSIVTRGQPPTNPNSVTNQCCDDSVFQKVATIANILLTAAIAFAAGQTWRVYRNLRDHAVQIERAYIGFGILLTEEPRDGLRKPLRLTLQLHNFGNTPATVEHVEAAYMIGRPNLSTDGPSYEHRFHIDQSRPFLVKGGDYIRRNIPFDISIEDWAHILRTDEIPMQEWTLCLVGFVRYRDRFNRCHEAGFGRVVSGEFDEPITDATNVRKRTERLSFVKLPNYNYDVPIDEDGNRQS